MLQDLIENKEASITIVRPGLIYESRYTKSFAVLVDQGKFVIFSSGNNSLQMIYVRDVICDVLQGEGTEQAICRV